MTKEQIRARRSELRQQLVALKAKAGGSFMNLTGDSPIAVEAQGIVDEMDVLDRREKQLDGQPDYSRVGGAPPGAGRDDRSPVKAQMRGWKSGHWSEPFTAHVKDLTPSGSVTVPSLTAGIVRIEDRPTRLLDVIPAMPLALSDQYAYLRETVRTNNAAPTAAQTLKPTSVYSVEKVEDRARTIAHLSQPISRFDLEDASLLREYVDGSLRAGVMLALDNQILNGDGVGENLTGITNTSGIGTILFATDLLTTTRKAVTALEAEEIYGGQFVLAPETWEALELTASAGAPGGYVLGGPVDRAAQRLWGRQVIVTSAQPSTVGHLVEFAGSTRLYERESVRVDWSEAPVGSVAGEAAFKTNELVFRGEGRYGWAVLRPAGVVEFPTA